MKNFKRIFAFLLSFSMIMGLVAIPNVSAATYTSDYSLTDPSVRADFTYEYLGQIPKSHVENADTPAEFDGDYAAYLMDLKNKANINDFTWENGGIILVGAKLSNMDKLTNMFNPTGDNNATRGLKSMVFSLGYDSDYFETTEDDNWTTGFINEQLVMPFLPRYKQMASYKPLYGLSAGFDSSNNGDYATELGVPDTAPTIETPLLDAASGSDKSKLKILQYNLNLLDSVTSTGFNLLFMPNAWYLKEDGSGGYEQTNKTEMLVGVFALKMKSEPAAGSKVIQGYLDKVNASIQVGTGTGSNPTNYDYDTTRTKGGSGGNANLKNRFNYVTLVDIMPSDAKITYHSTDGSWEGGVTEKIEDSKSNRTPEKADEYGDSLIPPDGKVFGGWYKSSSVDEESGDTVYDMLDTSLTIGADMDVYALWVDGYNVTFDATGGKHTDGVKEKITIQKGKDESVFDSADADKDDFNDFGIGNPPTRDGYTFKGWYVKDSTGAFTGSALTATDLQAAVYNKNTTIAAKWLADDDASKTQRVNFNVNTSATTTAVDPTDVGYATGDTLKGLIGGLPVSPTRSDGYIFQGWYDNESGDGTALTEDTALPAPATGETEITYYAKWGYLEDTTPQTKDNTVKVTFVKNNDTDKKYSDADGGTYKIADGVIADKYVKIDDVIEHMPSNDDIEAPEGKALKGWYTAATDGVKVDETTTINNATLSTSFTGDGTDELLLYAQYEDLASVTFDANGGNFAGDGSPTTKVISKAPGSKIFTSTETLATTVTEPTRDGYTFRGWYLKNATSGEFENVPDPSDLTYEGPATDAILQATDLTDGATYYAMWTKNSGHTIKFDSNVPADETVTDAVPAEGHYTTGQKVSEAIGGLPVAPVRDGYDFKGWYDNASCDGTALTAETVIPDPAADADPADTRIYYAKWEYTGTDKVTVHFVKDGDKYSDATNGGTYSLNGGTIENKVVKIGDKIVGWPDENLTSPDPSKVFVGWYTGADGTGKKVTSDMAISDAGIGFDTTTITPDSTLNLYAYFVDEFEIQYDLNGLTGATAPDKHENVKVTDTGIKTKSMTMPEDYTLIEWNTKPDGTGKSYDVNNTEYDGADFEPNLSGVAKLYAIYNYDATKDDAVIIKFHGNGTGTKPATVTPHDTDPSEDTNTYTMVRKAGTDTTVTVAQFPAAARDPYIFHHWGDKANETLSGTSAAITIPSLAEITADADKKNIDKYAIWDINDEDSWTVTFQSNVTPIDGGVPAAIKVAKDDVIGPAMPDQYKKTDDSDKTFEWQGWMDNTSGTVTAYDADTAFDPDTVAITADTTIKGFLAEKLVVKFDKNGATTPAADIDDVEVVSGGTVGSDMPADPTRTNYTFKGWYYLNDSGDLTKFESITPVTKTIEVHALWLGTYNVTFNDEYDDASDDNTINMPYTGSARTPFTDGKWKAVLDGTDPEVDITSDIKDNLTAEYKKTSEADTAYSSTVPSDVESYNIRLTLTLNKEITESGETIPVDTTNWMAYTPNLVMSQYNITEQDVDYKLGDIYQYIANISDVTAPTLTKKGPDDANPALTNLFTDGDGDVKITIKDKDGNDVTPADGKVTAFGEYTLEITAKDGSNYGVGKIYDTDGTTELTSPIKFYVVPSARTVHFIYGYGTGDYASAHVKDSADKEIDYTTVTIPAPSPLSDVSAATVSLADGGETGKKDLPVEDTDFVAPTGYTLDKFVLSDEDGNPIKADGSAAADESEYVEFTKDYQIPAGSDLDDKFYVLTIWKKAEWTVTFKDTKTGTDKEADIKYTVEATKKIEDTEAVKEVDDVAVSGTDIPDDVPTPANMPENKEFWGWSTDKTWAEGSITGNYKAADFTDAQIDTKFDKSTDPGSESAYEVYAVYVLGDDSGLSDVVFKERQKNADGTALETKDIVAPYKTDDTFTTNTPADTENSIDEAEFNPSDDDKVYYVLVSNDAEEAEVTITTKLPGSTISVAYKDGSDADQTATTSPVNIPLKIAKDKSMNEVKITVTPPSGDTTKNTEYTFKILRKAKAGIIMDYGNSPAGLIMRDMSHVWSDAVKKDLITEFAESDSVANGGTDEGNLHYTTGKVPDNGNATLSYIASAWNKYRDDEDAVINYDLNPYALFVYQTSQFNEPLVTGQDEYGNNVTLTKVFNVKEQNYEGVSRYSGDDTADGVSTINLFTAPAVDSYSAPATYDAATKKFDISNRAIRTDVYFIEYSGTYTDMDGVTQTITDKKPVIILGRIGDIFLQRTAVVNDGDANYLKKNFSSVNAGNSLVAFRNANIIGDSTPVVNDGDANYLKKNFSSINAISAANQYYINLSE